MNQLSPKTSEHTEEKRKLFCWLVQWLNNDENTEPIKFDLPELSVIMQALGFKLEKFEKTNSAQNNEDTLSVEFMCGKSGMRSKLSKQNSTCKCPQDEDVAKSEFWTVSACGPSSQENINTSFSSLLPTLSKPKSKAIVTLLNGTLFVINSAITEVKQKESLPDVAESSLAFKRSGSLDTLKTSVLQQKGLKRQHSWEVDPKTSPPTKTSSPFPSLCASMSQVSLSSGSSSELIQNLKSIQKLINDTIEIASNIKNITFTKSKYKRVSDIRPTEGPTVEEIQQNGTPNNKRVTPRRILTPKKFSKSSDKKAGTPVLTSLKTCALKKRIISGTKASPALRKNSKDGTPGTSVTKKPNLNGAVTELPAKSKIASYVGLTPKMVYKVAKTSESETNSSNSAVRFKTVVKPSAIASYKQKM